jgi:hypothetical protein
MSNPAVLREQVFHVAISVACFDPALLDWSFIGIIEACFYEHRVGHHERE